MRNIKAKSRKTDQKQEDKPKVTVKAAKISDVPDVKIKKAKPAAAPVAKSEQTPTKKAPIKNFVILQILRYFIFFKVCII